MYLKRDYRTYTDTTIPASFVGELPILLHDTVESDEGFILVEPGTANEESIYFHRSDGSNTVYIYHINRNTPHSHSGRVNVSLVNSIDYFNYLLDQTPRQAYIYRVDNNNIVIKGGKFYIGSKMVDIPDLDTRDGLSDKTLTSNSHNYIYIKDEDYFISPSVLSGDEYLIAKVWVDVSGQIGHKDILQYNAYSIGTKGEKGDAATVAVGNTTTLPPGSSATVSNSGDSNNAVFDFGIPKGDKGNQGPAATIAVGTTSTGNAGTNASVTNVGTSGAAVLNFTIPRGDKGDQGDKGDKGDKGDQGDAATITVGNTTTGNAGTNASVTNVGTSGAAVLNFTIPRGDKGDQGDKGDKGDAATITVGSTSTGNAGTNASVTNSGTSGAAVLEFTIPRGDKGDKGDAATITVGNTTTGNAGTNASVTNVGTSGAAILNFTIPKGADGQNGANGDEVELRKTSTHIQWKLTQDTTWNDLVALTDIKGDQGIPGNDGDDVQMRLNGGYIQWKLLGDVSWNNIIDTASLVGPAGDSITSVVSNKVGKTTTVTISGTFSGSPEAFTIQDGSDGLDINWLGDYDGATSYVVNDVVSYNGSSYICKLASTGNLPTNTTYFDLMAQKGADGIGAGDMLKSENLSGLANYATARQNLGLDTTANQTDSTDKRFMTDAQKNKLDGIEDNANNYILPADVVQDATYVKTDNNYTTAEKNKLAGIEAGAEVNNISDIDATDLTDGGDTSLHSHDGRYYTKTEIDQTLLDKAEDNEVVKLTGNQTIGGTKTFSSTISGNISGNSGTATALQTARTINGVSFNGSANITLPTVNTSGNQTIAGIKTFSSSPIVPTPTTDYQVATKIYVDTIATGSLNYIGAYDASTNIYPSGTIKKGDLWIISVAGTLGGEAIQVGDWIVANVDSPGQTAANWNSINKNIDYVPEDEANKDGDIETNKASTTKYPTIKGVYDWVMAKIANFITKVEDDTTPKLGGDLDADSKKITNLANGTASGDAVNKSQLDTKEDVISKNTAFNKNFGTGSTDVARGDHNHSGVYEPVITKNTAFNKNFGSGATDVATGNHTHTFASLTSKPTSISGYGITDAYTKTEVDNLIPDTTRLDTNTKTGNYTLVLSDAGKVIRMNNSSAATLTIPANASVAFPTGTIIHIERGGNGDVTIGGAGGVTIQSVDGNKKIADRYGGAYIRKSEMNTWILVGGLGA